MTINQAGDCPAIKSLCWSSAGVSDPGKRRSLNEDAFLDRPDAGLWVVADGMGGHARGDLASSMVVEGLTAVSDEGDLESTVGDVCNLLQSINRELVSRARQQKLGLIGCTIVVLLVRPEGRFACIWAGDSRFYLFRNGSLNQVSRDHSAIQRLVDRGIIEKRSAENHPSANVINRAIGAEERLELDVIYGNLNSGDRCLLCSDGLYREVMEHEISQTLADGDGAGIAVAKLMRMALSRGARDNVTLVAVDITGNTTS